MDFLDYDEKLKKKKKKKNYENHRLNIINQVP